MKKIGMSYDRLHDEYGKVVYRLYNSCISSIQKITEIPLSSFYQLGLGVDLSYLG